MSLDELFGAAAPKVDYGVSAPGSLNELFKAPPGQFTPTYTEYAPPAAAAPSSGPLGLTNRPSTPIDPAQPMYDPGIYGKSSPISWDALMKPSAPNDQGFLGLGGLKDRLLGNAPSAATPPTGPNAVDPLGSSRAVSSGVTGFLGSIVSPFLKQAGSYLSNPASAWNFSKQTPEEAAQRGQNAEGMFGAIGGGALPYGIPEAALGRDAIGAADLRPVSDVTAIRDITPSALEAPREPLALPAPRPTRASGAGADVPLYDTAMPMEGAIAQPSSRGFFWGAPDKSVAPIEGQFRELPQAESAVPAPVAPITEIKLAQSEAPQTLVPGRKYTFADLQQNAGIPEGQPLFAPGEKPMGVAKPQPELAFAPEQSALAAKVAAGRDLTNLPDRAASDAVDAAAGRVPTGGDVSTTPSLSDQLAASLRAKGRPDLIVGEDLKPVATPPSEYVAASPGKLAIHNANEGVISAMRDAVKSGDLTAVQDAIEKVISSGGDLNHTVDRLRAAGLPAPTRAQIRTLTQQRLKGEPNVPSSSGVPAVGGGLRDRLASFNKDQGGEARIDFGLTGPEKKPLTLDDMRPISGGADFTRADLEAIRNARRDARFGAPNDAVAASNARADAGFDKLLNETKPTATTAPAAPKPEANPGRFVPTGGQRPPNAQTPAGLPPGGGGRKLISWATLSDALNIPRTLMTTGDISYSLRQGLVLGVGHPVKMAKAMGEQIRAFGSAKLADQYMQQIVNDPAYKTLRDLGLTITDTTGKLGPMEEGFLSKTLGNAPIVRNSNRAGVTFLNSLRFSVAKDALRAAEIANPDVMTTARSSQLKGLMEFINAASGRSDLPMALEKYGDALNGVFFSPRFFLSRANVAIALPKAALTRNPLLAKEAARDIAALAIGGYGVMQLAQMNGATVVSDPTSSDWGKIQVGNTRIDIWGGLQQPARLIAQMIAGEKTSLAGNQTILADTNPVGDFAMGALGGSVKTSSGYDLTPKSRSYELGRFVRGKYAPVPATAVDLLSGKNFIGQKATIGNEAAKLATPLALQDIYDAIADDLKQGGNGLQGAGVGALGLLGVGVQTIPTKFADTPTIPEALIGAAGGQPFFRENPAPTSSPKPTKTPAPSKTPKR